MVIIETNLNFGTLEKRKETNAIAVHHAAADELSIYDIHEMHLARGYAGVGYHYLVRKDGSIYPGRPIETVGAHASGRNYDTIGICFEGNYDQTKTMPLAQLNAGKELVASLKKTYGIDVVLAHKEINATACPGRYFPFEEIATARPENYQNKNSFKCECPYIKMGDNSDGLAMLLWQTLLRGRGYSAVGLTRKWDDETYIATLDYKKRIGEISEGDTNADITAKVWKSILTVKEI